MEMRRTAPARSTALGAMRFLSERSCLPERIWRQPPNGLEMSRPASQASIAPNSTPGWPGRLHRVLGGHNFRTGLWADLPEVYEAAISASGEEPAIGRNGQGPTSARRGGNENGLEV